ncbi:VWA domain-containing protein [Chitinimonas sp.]|uniref:vWA domain-containing protein n=1 Tax=Chitinimonas sp. TaxID=1934313 RepID=UPI002F9572BD
MSLRSSTLLSLLLGACLAACSTQRVSTPAEAAPSASEQPATEAKVETVTVTGAAIRRADLMAASPSAPPAPPPAPKPLRQLGQAQEKRAADAQRLNVAPPAFVAPALPAPVGIAALPEPADRERYQTIVRHGVQRVAEAPVSTFSIDVDTASYSNVRRLLNRGQLPPQDAVRVEELVNYFPYQYPQPSGNAPFSVSTELAPTPWNPDSLLLRIGIQAADPAKASLPPANLVFLVDVSGSMNEPAKLPLLKQALKLFVRELRPQDHVSLVTYASGTRVVLEPTAGDRKAVIEAAIDDLRAGGATAGAAGIELAYRMAEQGFLKQGINRILLATDGDFNVGITRFETLKNRVEEKRRSGISLSTLGFGEGNYNDALMEQLADAGDGAYSYIDNLNEAQKVLVDEFTSTLATVAHDVKIQLEFNPDAVLEYRQIGFENRALRREDFNNDKVDAGEIGAGHRVTALYEITLVGQRGKVEPLRYRINKPQLSGKDAELGFLKLRYKPAHGQASLLLSVPIARSAVAAQGSEDFRFAAAVAAFGQRLADGGRYLGKFDLPQIRELAAGARGEDRFGYRGEFLRLVNLAQNLAQGTPPATSAAAAVAD